MTTSPERSRLVLSESDAVELLSYLVTAARTQVDEAAEYAPMRILNAAQRLAAGIRSAIGEQDGPLADLVVQLTDLQPVVTPTRDPDGYRARLDELCVAVADCLLALYGEPDTGGSTP